MNTNEDQGTTVTSTEAIVNETDAEAARPLAFVSGALDETARKDSRLLETLILGGGLLYAVDRVNGNQNKNWFKRLFTAKRGFYLLGGAYERVITVFKSEAENTLDRVVAAKITDERIEIIAEQHLPMDLMAASAKHNADLQRELKLLVEKVTKEACRKGDLLFYDPCLKNELEIYEALGKYNDELRIKSLNQKISKLNETELIKLESWLKSPTKSKITVRPVQEHLRKRQSQLRRSLSHEKSVLVSVLELSLAMKPNVVI